jgi:hypothetical protein
MTEGPSGARGDAAWKEQREAIAKRNVEAHRRGQAERKTRDRAVEDRDRMEAAREAAQLHELNQQIAKQRPGGSR